MPPAIDKDAVMGDILAAIATTPKSLDSICKSDKRFPNAATVYRWIDADSELCERYTRAKEAQLQVLADQLVDLADNDRICRKVTIKPDGSEEIVILDQVDRTKLQIDTRKWLLAKLNPKKYGDKVEQFISGPGGGPIQSAISVEFVRPDAVVSREDDLPLGRSAMEGLATDMRRYLGTDKG